MARLSVQPAKSALSRPTQALEWGMAAEKYDVVDIAQPI